MNASNPWASDNPLASAGVSNKEWEASMFAFLQDETQRAPQKRPPGPAKVVSPEFGAIILDRFPNLTREEKAFFKARLFL